MDTNRKIEKAFTLASFILSLLVLLGFVPVGGSWLFRGAAESALRGLGADSVSVGGVSVALWMGVRVKNVAVYKRISDRGDGYRVGVDNADIRCNLFGAAVALIADSAVFKSNRDVFREVYERPFELAGDVSRAVGSLRWVKKVALRGAGIGFVSRGQPGVSVSGADVAVGRERGGALSGGVSVGEAVIPALVKVDNFKAKVSLDDDKLELTAGAGTVFGGKLRVGLSVDIRQSKILDGYASLRGMDLEKFCAGTVFSPGALVGKAEFDARIKEVSHAHIDSVKANGSVTVKNLTATDLALQKAPIVGQLSKDLRSLRFSEVKGDFVLTGGKLHFKDILGTGDVLKFRSAGWVGLDGKLSQDFEGELSRNFVAGLPKLVRNSLEKTGDEGGRFKCKIDGTFHKPRIEVDKSVYDRAIGGFFKGLFK